ncbi:MAG: hypothetical protein JNL21_03970 [Myxococcales bacterium]|nr:hypothetical protein [Myxococcales bacterium]
MVGPTSLVARILSRRALTYTDGAQPAEDRPAHVRAASGVVRVGSRLCVLQDDAGFIATIEPDGRVDSLALPRRGGRRRFEERFGNRLTKPDLEAGDVVAGPEGPRLLALGSGSLPVREVAVLATPRPGTEIGLLDASPLFDALRSALDIPREQVNVEGCVAMDGVLRLFQRGPTSASVDFELASVVAWLDGGPSACPRGESVRRYDLGNEGGVLFGFSDAAAIGDGRVVCLAVAEDTDDPVEDGAILGSRVGIIEGAVVRLGPLLDEEDRPVMSKAEGICPDPARPGRFHVVLDPDDPDLSAELCEVEVTGL